MCSPATVVAPDVKASPATAEQPDTSAVQAPRSWWQKFRRWLLGWKQTLIAELASLGSPKEGFR